MQWIVVIINFYILIDLSDPAGTEYMCLQSCLIDHSLRFHAFKGYQWEDIWLIFLGVRSEPAAN